VAYRVPFVDAREHYRRYRGELETALTSTVANGDLILRQQLRDFEANLAAFCGTKYAVGLNSGYHALHLSLLAAGIKPGDEVITVAHTFVATVSAIVHCGATPVLVDVTSDYNMDVDGFEKAITPRTRGVIPVHLNGRMADMTRIMQIAERHNLIVVEDAAQSLGATVDGRRAGSIGTTGCFSFYPFKILGCFGDGGAITTNDAEIATAVSRLRYNGEDRETGEYHYHGYTALLDNVQAAVLDVKLRHLPAWIEHRRKIAEAYTRGMTGVGDLRLPPAPDARYYDVFQNYVIRTKRRDELRAFLKENGVETLLHWPKPVWEHKALGLSDPSLPETVRICREVLSLPMSAETTPEHVEIVVDVARRFFG
jgi:dTDP-4-amino-4,6-dideoxygalactose transaminase